MKPYDKYVDLVVNEILKFYTPDRDKGIMRSKKAPRIFFTPIKNSKYVEWSLPSYKVEKEMTQAIEDYADKASISTEGGELGADFITLEEQRLYQAINNKLVDLVTTSPTIAARKKLTANNFYKVTLYNEHTNNEWFVFVEANSEEEAREIENAYLAGNNDLIKILDIERASKEEFGSAPSNLKLTKHPTSQFNENHTDGNGGKSDTTTYYQVWAKGPSDKQVTFIDEFEYMNDLIKCLKWEMMEGRTIRVFEVQEDESGNIVGGKKNEILLFDEEGYIEDIDKGVFDVATPQETANLFGKKVYSKKEDRMYIPSAEGKEIDFQEKLQPITTNKVIKEEYGSYKDEIYCDVIGDALENYEWSGYVDEEEWTLEINGFHQEDFFTMDVADYMTYDISYPVKDGHLNYYGLDIIMYQSWLADTSADVDSIKHDLMLLCDDTEAINKFLEGELEELEFWVDYDVNFDVDAWEEAQYSDEEEAEDEEYDG